jgi:hypothetical protein
METKSFEVLPTQGCQTFLDTKYQKGENIPKLPLNYRMAMKYTKWQKYIPNGHTRYKRFPF